jgi:basic membrane lipoprotein Med (substrate-binding protein (PBP1-ABC) superfamily)
MTKRYWLGMTLGIVGTVVAASAFMRPVLAADKPITIGLVEEARPEVEPWSLAWHNAAEALKKRDPSIKVIETYDAYDATRAEPVIRQMLDSGAGVLALSTFVLTDIAKTVAKEFPKVPMVLTSFGVTQAPNLSSGTASYLEIGYSACWLLEKMSKSGKVGYIGAMKAPFEAEVLTGCKLGATAANPKAQVVEGYTNSFTNTEANHEQVKKLLDQGITEIMLGSGTEDTVGGLRLCQSSHAHCATWGGDARRWAPNGCVLTVVLNWDVVMEDLVKQARTGEVGPPKSWDLTYENKGLSVTDFSKTDAVSPALQTEFKTVIADLASGKTKLPESKAHPGAR